MFLRLISLIRRKKSLSEQYDEYISEYIDSFSNPYEMHNIELMSSHRYFVSNIESIGITAAENNSTDAVKISTSILLDLFLSTRNPQRTGAITNQVSKDRYSEALSNISDAGGKEAIESLFSEIGDLPRLELEEGDSKIEAYGDLVSDLDEQEDWQFVRFNEYYLGRDILQELLDELAQETNIEFKSNS